MAPVPPAPSASMTAAPGLTAAQHMAAGSVTLANLAVAPKAAARLGLDAAPRVSELRPWADAVLADALGRPRPPSAHQPRFGLSVQVTEADRTANGRLLARIALALVDGPSDGGALRWRDSVVVETKAAPGGGHDGLSALLAAALRRTADDARFRRALMALPESSRSAAAAAAAAEVHPVAMARPSVPGPLETDGPLVLNGAPLFLAPLEVNAGALADPVATVLTNGEQPSGVALLLSADGWAVTADVAVGAADVVRLRLSDGRTPWARVLRRAPSLGVVLLGVAAERLAALPVRPTPVQPGETVFAVAPHPRRPAGVQVRENTVTDGRATALALARAPTVPAGSPVVDAWANGAAVTVSGPGDPRRPVVPLLAALEALGARVRTPPPAPAPSLAPPLPSH